MKPQTLNDKEARLKNEAKELDEAKKAEGSRLLKEYATAKAKLEAFMKDHPGVITIEYHLS